jgi:hypothetical protein
VWESHKPAEGGAAGKMLAQIIEKAAKLKAGRGSNGKAKAGAAAGRKKTASKQSTGKSKAKRKTATSR